MSEVPSLAVDSVSRCFHSRVLCVDVRESGTGRFCFFALLPTLIKKRAAVLGNDERVRRLAMWSVQFCQFQVEMLLSVSVSM
jgi:hypothetical protein